MFNCDMVFYYLRNYMNLDKAPEQMIDPHGAGRAGGIRQIENRRIRVLAIKPLKHSLKIMRRTAAGARCV